MALVSVLMPSRKRPESLARAVSSLAYGDVEIIVGLDEDDPTVRQAEDLVAPFPGVRVCVNPRFQCLGVLFNRLAEQADSEWIVPFPDDYTMDDPNWAEVTYDTLQKLPKKLGVSYIWDPIYPHFASMPIVSKTMIRFQGFYMPPFFPFLFGDTWWNEIGVMACMIVGSPASASLTKDAGMIHNFRNLRLWSNVFEKTRPLREDLAVRMIREVATDSEAADYMIASMPERKAMLVQQHAQFQTDEFCDQWNGVGDGFPHPMYDALEAKAMKFMEAS